VRTLDATEHDATLHARGRAFITFSRPRIRRKSLIALTPVEALGVYLLGTSTFVVAVIQVQPSEYSRLHALPTGLSACVMSLGLAWLLHSGRRRERIDRSKQCLEIPRAHRNAGPPHQYLPALLIRTSRPNVLK
jgi:hypothetical protein